MQYLVGICMLIMLLALIWQFIVTFKVFIGIAVAIIIAIKYLKNKKKKASINRVESERNEISSEREILEDLLS